MKIGIASDLHLEFQDIHIPNQDGVDVLVLAGDILIAQELHDRPPGGSPDSKAERFRGFLGRVSQDFPHVVYIAGNHEFYHGRWWGSLDHIREAVSPHPNIHFLEDQKVEIGGVTFLGATMWTDLNRGDPVTVHAIAGIMNDYRVIRVDNGDGGAGWGKLRPMHTLERHRRSRGWLEREIAGGQRLVVVTHHTPSFQSCAPEYRHDREMNGGYHTEMFTTLADNPQILAWIHGHTHHPFDYTIGSTRVVCNPRGYSGWDRSADDWQLKVIEV